MKRKFKIFRIILAAIVFGIILTGGCNKKNLTSNEHETVTDVDGNVYHTATIGKQVWMVEDLKVTKYRNGDSIPNVKSKAQWSSLVSGAYCNYDNDTNNVDVYGRLYNWHAVNDYRNIAPEGWHVPTERELENLTNALGGSFVAGGKMKETGTKHWLKPNMAATNESSFSALPCGYRDSYYGTFHLKNYNYFYWSVAEKNDTTAWVRMLSSNHAEVFRSYASKANGFSIRCVKD